MTDIYKLDARVTILFSQAQKDALREVAYQNQTSVGAFIRRLVIVGLQDHYLEQSKNIMLIKKEKQDG